MDSSIWERIIIGTSKGCMKNACVRKEITRKGMGVQVDTSEGFKTVTYKHASRLGAEERER